MAALAPHLFAGATRDEPTVITGDWGTLEYYEVALEPPTSVLWSALFEERSYWSFGELPRVAALELLKSLGFSSELVEKVDRDGIWKETDTITEVDINDDIVESMTTSNRTAYAAWARANQPNYLQKQIMNLEILDDDSLHRRLKPSTVALIRSLTFLRKKVVSVMDRGYMMRQLGDDEAEKQALIQTLFSVRTLLARLVVEEDADIEALIDYWTAGGLNPGAETILRAVHSSPGVDRIDLAYLLPPFPKKYMGTFIQLDDTSPVQAPDCFWASIHFFKKRVSERLLDKLFIDHYLDYDFERVEDEPKFGDMIVLFDAKDGDFVHSYVQIAGPLVFTKNGSSFARPIVLKTKENMMQVYEEGYVFETEIYRRKPGT